ncbi:MAG: hypothetical protein IT380_03385 [Myxococcales bacterium]|nr:hypothetical protein [Myxococcales bacterium]
MSHRVTFPCLFVAALAAGACATLSGKGDPEEIKPAIESFHQALRWKDYRGAADRLVPERRAAFIKARLKNEDERDLFITDFQLEDAVVAADQMSATVVSKLSWYRLPDGTEKKAVITTSMVWRDSAWLVESQDEGPFSAELPGKSPPKSDPAAP